MSGFALLFVVHTIPWITHLNARVAVCCEMFAYVCSCTLQGHVLLWCKRIAWSVIKHGHSDFTVLQIFMCRTHTVIIYGLCLLCDSESLSFYLSVSAFALICVSLSTLLSDLMCFSTYSPWPASCLNSLYAPAPRTSGMHLAYWSEQSTVWFCARVLQLYLSCTSCMASNTPPFNAKAQPSNKTRY